VASENVLGNSSWAAIFEDDAILSEEFSQTIAALQAQPGPLGTDLIYLGHCETTCRVKNGHCLNLGKSVNLVASKDAECTHAYLISVNGAKQLLDFTTSLEHAIDEEMNRHSQCNAGGIHSLILCPPIAFQPWQSQDQRAEGTCSSSVNDFTWSSNCEHSNDSLGSVLSSVAFCGSVFRPRLELLWAVFVCLSWLTTTGL
jgi:GR25 family glycosyltransferase involved in LPS biosynthesis